MKDIFGAVVGVGNIEDLCARKGLSFDAYSSFVEGIAKYEPPEKQVRKVNLDRKWEIVSGIQKAIRRGEAEIAVWLASALFNSEDKEAARYFWRRIAVVAVEDVAFGNVDLVVFTLLCATVYPVVKMQPYAKDVGLFLVDALSKAVKDRTLCDMEVAKKYYTEALERKTIRETLTEEEYGLLKMILYPDKYVSGDPVSMYIMGEKSRTEGLGLFFGLASEVIGGEVGLSVPGKEPPPSTRILGIPSYAYDMHTRTGLTTILAIGTLS